MIEIAAILLFGIIAWVCCGVGAGIVASNRGAKPGGWFLLGFFLGPIGLALAFTSNSGVVCPACRKGIHPEASKCPYCQTDIGDMGGRLVKCGACWSEVQPTSNHLCPRCQTKLA